MKLTDTQRKFRREMKKLNEKPDQINESPYDDYFFRKPGSENTGNIGFLSVVVFCIVFFVIWTIRGTVIERPKGVNTAIATAKSTSTGERSLSLKDAKCIEQLYAQQKLVGEALNKVAQHHNTPWNSRDIKGYNDALMKALAVCSKSDAVVNSLVVPPEFDSLKKITSEYILYSSSAITNWHDSLPNGRGNAVERGNYFLNLSRQKALEYNLVLENFLKDNGYKYEKTDTGLRYWHTPY